MRILFFKAYGHNLLQYTEIIVARYGLIKYLLSRARAVFCYVWMHYLRQSGRVLAKELGVSPQAVYAASSRVERDGGLDAEVLERWCR